MSLEKFTENLAAKFEVTGARVLWFLLACLLLAGCVGMAHGQDVDGGPATAEAVLTGMASQAGMIFAGQVVGIKRADENGYVDVSFRVDQAVRGCTQDSTYVVREWVGLWVGQVERYRVGQRLLMLLTAKSAAGFSAPVNGMDGAIPLLANVAPPLMHEGGVVPADAAADGKAGNEMLADLRWVRARAVRAVGTAAAATTGSSAAAVSAGKAGWVPVTGTEFTPISDWVGPIAPMAAGGPSTGSSEAGSGQSTEPSLSTVLALLQRFQLRCFVRHGCRWLLMMVSLFVLARGGLASGPRWVTGRPFFTTDGQPVPWHQSNLLYYTDPGGLSAAVNHQAADALVAAAAGVWNLPVANITVGLGGALAEHVSSANLYLGPGGMVYPADVDKANYASVPIAVIYDTDGSVTDTLLGVGASSPSSCRQNGVTESVDRFDPAGYIQHAIIVMNGRCTGTAPQLQLQMQYQLERVFGRVLGVAWSQTNDNVLMGSPTPTYNQALHWPIMHPIDILCGAYTYQCLPQPFVLRPDDIASMVMLYPVGSIAATGKQPSLQSAQGLYGSITFPAGEGMAGVNMLVRRESQGNVQEGWYESSAVSGAMFHTNGTSPFVTADTSAIGSEGTGDINTMGNYSFPYIPMMQTGMIWQNLVLSTEAVNPLYFGPYSLQPYTAGTVSPGGSAPTPKTAYAYVGGPVPESFTIADAPTVCGTGTDGTASAPVVAPSTGWWDGQLCGQGHASYVSLAVQPARTLTVEVTALDEQGYATTAKAMPVIGIYAPTDGVNDLPSVAVASNAFQSVAVGTTTLSTSTGSLTQLKVGIADQRGAGRPDFAYQARIFYADTLLPATLPLVGGTVTIAGMGFRQGNQVTVNGVVATVNSVTANSISVTMPAMFAVHTVSGAGVDVVVSDLSTGASSTMTGALIYGANVQPNVMKVVTVQAGTMYVGDTATVPFAVQIVQGDGATPVAGASVVFTTSAGAVSFGACGGATCTVATDANGIASTGVTATTAGAVTMVATSQQLHASALTQSASFTVLAQDASLTTTSAPEANLTVGTASQSPFSVRALGAGGRASSGRQITFSVTAGSATLSGCNAAVCAVTTDWTGTANVNVTAAAAGTITLLATDGSLTQSVSMQAAMVDDLLLVNSVPLATNPVNRISNPLGIRLLHGDGVTPDPFEHVVYSAPTGVQLTACGASTCILTTDLQGYASSTMTSSQAGTYPIRMSFGAVTQTVAVTFVVPAPSMRLVTTPTGTQPVGSAVRPLLTIQMLQADGVTPMANVLVSFAGPAGNEYIVECGDRPGCNSFADATGTASATIVPLRAGPMTVTANYGTLSQSTTFAAVGTTDTMVVLASPGAGTCTGDTEAFTVQVFGVDGVTPAAGKSVVFSVTSGAFSFTGCGATTCAVVTDSSGKATVSGVATAAGSVSVMAADGPVTQTMTFSTTARADVMHLLSGPGGSVMSSYPAGPVFAVQVLQPDGVTPAAGRTVTFAVSVGSARFGACGGAPCSVITDATGRASTLVTPLAAGATTVLAAESPVYVSDSFTAVLADGLQVVSAPASGNFMGDVEAVPFALRVLAGDGVTPLAGRPVVLSVTSGSAGFGACTGASVCTLVSDASGNVSSAVTPLAVGSITLSAADGPVTQSATFTVVAKPDSMALVSTPPGSGYVGDAMPDNFAVQLIEGDGVTGDAGQRVTFSVTSGSALLGACGASTCVVVTDATGVAKTSVTPLVPGAVTVAASAAAVSTGTETASFVAVRKPDGMSVVSSAGTSVYEGATAAQVFAVRVLLADGITPDVGVAVTFTGLGVAGGAVQFTACGAVSCTVMTDKTGLAATGVVGVTAGAMTLLATADSSSGAKSVSVPLQVVANVYSLNATTGTLYVAAGASFATMVGATATLNGNPVAGLAVSWTTVNATLPSGNSTVTDALGGTLGQVLFSPVGTGQATVTGCAWTSQCATVAALGVAADEFVLGIVSGGAQQVSGGGALVPVTALVTDGAGHPVAGAAVTVSQTVSALTQACTGHGRCPAAPVLGSGVSVLISNASGTVSLLPMTVAGTATDTMLVLTAGTHGLANADAKSQP